MSTIVVNEACTGSKADLPGRHAAALYALSASGGQLQFFIDPLSFKLRLYGQNGRTAEQEVHQAQTIALLNTSRDLRGSLAKACTTVMAR